MEKRGLAASGLSDDTNKFASPGLEGYIIEDGVMTVSNREMLYRNGHILCHSRENENQNIKTKIKRLSFRAKA